MCRLVDVRSYAFVVARALVTEIEKLRQSSPNGQLQPDDILEFLAGSQKEVEDKNLLFVHTKLIL